MPAVIRSLALLAALTPAIACGQGVYPSDGQRFDIPEPSIAHLTGHLSSEIVVEGRVYAIASDSSAVGLLIWDAKGALLATVRALVTYHEAMETEPYGSPTIWTDGNLRVVFVYYHEPNGSLHVGLTGPVPVRRS